MTVEQRIASVMPMMISLVSEWWSRLRPREQAAADPEDLLTIIWIELREKDASFDPARGYKYITWAATVARHKLGEQRNFLRVVHSPRNASGRLAAESCKKSTAERVQVSLREPVSIHLASSRTEGCPPLIMDDAPADSRMADRRIVQWAMSRLPSGVQSAILAMFYGLDGTEPMRIIDIARRLSMDPADVSRSKAQAEQNLAVLLRSTEDESPEETDDESSLELFLN